MYQFSRAIYRELAPHIAVSKPGSTGEQEHVLHACEAVIERLATDRHYFARPARTLFCDVRTYFPMSEQKRVFQVISSYMDLAERFLSEHPLAGYAAVSGKPLQCRATTRKGAACQRVPLPRNGYCPSHQHLADTEDNEQIHTRAQSLAA
ncbi:MAG TPA: hypothetical protein VLJ42_13340 [Solirubrobacteraceae bacterium]|nr:hypothetical protein [Solirubrobacteraceae bacterium]